MKNLIFAAFVSLLLVSCETENTTVFNYGQDDVDLSSGDDDTSSTPTHCSYTLTLSPDTPAVDSNGEPCDVRVEFVFVSESGEEFRYGYVPANEDPPRIVLPHSTSFSGWIRDIGAGSSSTCGDLTWILSVDGEKCFELSEYVEERGDLISLSDPEFSFQTPYVDGECKCPTLFDPDADPCDEVVCPRGKICVDGVCVWDDLSPECEDDGSCPPDFQCLRGKCVPI